MTCLGQAALSWSCQLSNDAVRNLRRRELRCFSRLIRPDMVLGQPSPALPRTLPPPAREGLGERGCSRLIRAESNVAWMQRSVIQGRGGYFAGHTSSPDSGLRPASIGLQGWENNQDGNSFISAFSGTKRFEGGRQKAPACWRGMRDGGMTRAGSTFPVLSGLPTALSCSLPTHSAMLTPVMCLLHFRKLCLLSSLRRFALQFRRSRKKRTQ